MKLQEIIRNNYKFAGIAAASFLIDEGMKNYGEEYGKSLAHVFSVLEPFDEAGTDAINGAINFFKDNMKDKVIL